MIFWIITILALVTSAQLMRASLLAKKIANKKEEDITDADNNMNAFLFGLFTIFMLGQVVFMMWKYGSGLIPESASEHGEQIDFLFNINWIIVLAVFFIVNFVLFAFAIRYRGKKGNTAYYFAHDNRLEMIWTVVPACALAVLIIFGLRTWNDITSRPSDDTKIVEIFGEQFSWTVRYSGDDNKLGYADYKLTTGSNPLGVVTPESMDAGIAEMDKTINKLNERLKQDSSQTIMYSEAKVYEMQSRMEKFIRIKERINKMKAHYNDEQLLVANDDYITKVELHLIKGQEYQFIFRSKDVIHSAYFPHFRAQMNVVPGMRTKFKFRPTISTAEMRGADKRNDPNFNYILLCNKICGESHSNMNMIVVVDENIEEFNAWKAENTKSPITQN
jgi:cytochrome c oxidase subunit 2